MIDLYNKINNLSNNINYIRNRLKQILDILSITYESNDSIRKLITLLPVKMLTPKSLPNTLYGHTVIGLSGDNILITGGTINGNSSLNDNYIYNCRTGTKTSKASLDTARQKHFSIKIDDDNILITGGIEGSENSGTRITKNQIYNLKSNTFTSKSNMGTSKAQHNGNLLDNIVYLVGGTAGINTGIVNTWHLAYNLNNDTFTRKTDYSISSQAASKYNNHQFYFGGQINEYSEVRNFVKMYNKDNNTFTDKRNLPTARSELSSISLPDGNVILSGGYLRNNPKSNKNEMYVVSSNTFTNKSNLTPPRSDHAAVFLGSGGVLVGGKGSRADNEWMGNATNIVEFYNYYNDTFYKSIDN